MFADPFAATRGGYGRSRGRRDDRDDRYDAEPTRERYEKRAICLPGLRWTRAPPPPAKIKVENLHYDLTEDDIYVSSMTRDPNFDTEQNRNSSVE